MRSVHQLLCQSVTGCHARRCLTQRRVFEKNRNSAQCKCEVSALHVEPEKNTLSTLHSREPIYSSAEISSSRLPGSRFCFSGSFRLFGTNFVQPSGCSRHFSCLKPGPTAWKGQNEDKGLHADKQKVRDTVGPQSSSKRHNELQICFKNTSSLRVLGSTGAETPNTSKTQDRFHVSPSVFTAASSDAGRAEGTKDRLAPYIPKTQKTRKLCPHGRRRDRCKECGGSSLCKHGRRKYWCRECGGKGICEHGKHRYRCVECRGSGVCVHGRLRTTCKECKGSQICQHDRVRSKCAVCQKDNPAFAERREREKLRCKEDFVYRLTKNTRNVVYKCLSACRDEKPLPERKRTHEYLGCSYENLKSHLEKDDFHGNPGMSWQNYGTHWHVDHITPIMYVGPGGERPSKETQIARLHFSNLQPMWSRENLQKGNRYVGKSSAGLPAVSLQKKQCQFSKQVTLVCPLQLQPIVRSPLKECSPVTFLQTLSSPLHTFSAHRVSLSVGTTTVVNQHPKRGINAERSGVRGFAVLSFPSRSSALSESFGMGREILLEDIVGVIQSPGGDSELRNSPKQQTSETRLFRSHSCTSGRVSVTASEKLTNTKPKQKGKCPHGRQRYLCKECGGGGFVVTGASGHIVRIVGVVQYVNTEESAGTVGIATGRGCASTDANEGFAETVEETESAHMEGGEISARNVGEVPFVYTTDTSTLAGNVEGREYVNMDDREATAKSVEGAPFAFMAESNIGAKSAGGVESVSMDADETGAGIVEETPSACTDGRSMCARSVVEKDFVNMEGTGTVARSVMGKVSASTAVDVNCVGSVMEVRFANTTAFDLTVRCARKTTLLSQNERKDGERAL